MPRHLFKYWYAFRKRSVQRKIDAPYQRSCMQPRISILNTRSWDVNDSKCVALEWGVIKKVLNFICCFLIEVYVLVEAAPVSVTHTRYVKAESQTRALWGARDGSGGNLTSIQVTRSNRYQNFKIFISSRISICISTGCELFQGYPYVYLQGAYLRKRIR